MNSLCQLCQEAKATVHITDTLPEKRERHLCEGCAEKEGVIIKQHPQTTNEILQQFIKHKTGLGSAGKLACADCGMTFREFHLKGLLGCPQDYKVFEEALLPLIERAHEGASRHIGKIPLAAGDAVRKRGELLRLRKELDQAVQQEDYEQAASIRDKIQAVESH